MQLTTPQSMQACVLCLCDMHPSKCCKELSAANNDLAMLAMLHLLTIQVETVAILLSLSDPEQFGWTFPR